MSETWLPPTFTAAPANPAEVKMPRGEYVPQTEGDKQFKPPPLPSRLASPKTNMQLRELVLGALQQVGGEEYLIQQAYAYPQGFMTLLGKILPTQITGNEGGPVAVTTVDPSKLSTQTLAELATIRAAMAAESEKQ